MNRQNCIIPSAPDIALDTLEITSEFYENNLQLSGNGQIGFNLKKRAHSKALNTSLFGRMLYLNSNLHTQYQETFYCSHSIFIDGNKAKSKFCRRRWCMICNRIRTAQLISTYQPTIESWEEKEFITLTVKNMGKKELPAAISKMYEDFTKIKDLYRKKQSSKLVGVRKLELTYNRPADEYHPHFHFITNKADTDMILSQWLKRNPTAKASGQDAKKADNKSSFELFKYFTKLTSNSSKDNKITLPALDTIFNSIQGIRTFQPFGFVSHKEERPPEDMTLSENEMQEIINYDYNTKTKDWLNKETGELLTGYVEENDNLKKWENKILQPTMFEIEGETKRERIVLDQFPDTKKYLSQFENFNNNQNKNKQ